MNESQFMPTFRFASERDVDLLLVEEINCSREFLQFLLGCAFSQNSVASVSEWQVKHSISRTQSRREIDIRVHVVTKQGLRVCILLENKLDTGEQPNQGDSYRAECAALLSDRKFDLVSCGIVCPQSYAAKYNRFVAQFDFHISYEAIRAEIRARLERTQDLDEEIVARLNHREELLTQAIEKQRRGYVQIVLSEKADFNSKYVALARSMAPLCLPGTQMLRSDGNPAESVSMLFDSRGTFAEVPEAVRPRRLAHEFGRGESHRANYVAVTFARWGNALKALKAEFESDLKNTPYKLLAKVTSSRPNPGLVLYERTEPVAYERGFDDQLGRIEAGIVKLDSLRAWVIANQKVLQRWSILVGRWREC